MFNSDYYPTDGKLSIKKNVIGNNRVRVYTPENIKNFSPFPLVNDFDFSVWLHVWKEFVSWRLWLARNQLCPVTYRPKQQTCCAVLTDRSELPWFNNKKQNKNPKTKQCNSSECVQVRKSQELLTDTLALCEEHLQRASRSVGGARSWMVGRTITKEKFNCGGESRVFLTHVSLCYTLHRLRPDHWH